jgi:hypothetical protein
MAIGLSRVFGIKLPLNFDSPYKAVNIIEFWRRWHMTLSRFLRDYLYFSLGGNRKGPVRRHVNLMITMLLGGLWHGAGWTFVAWGGLHGLYLVVNHIWRAFRQRLGQDLEHPTLAGSATARVITFVAVVVGWVFFRASSFDDAIAILRGMTGMNGVHLPAAFVAQLPWIRDALGSLGVAFVLGGASHFIEQYAWVLLLLPLTIFAPNTQEILGRFQPALDFHGSALSAKWLAWQPSRKWGMLVALIVTGGLLSLSRVSEFLYYQF